MNNVKFYVHLIVFLVLLYLAHVPGWLFFMLAFGIGYVLLTISLAKGGYLEDTFYMAVLDSKKSLPTDPYLRLVLICTWPAWGIYVANRELLGRL